MKNVREPAVAGMFYPASAIRLKEDVQLLLDKYKPEKDFQNVFGIVSPHAGYAYSGRTAAYAYNSVANKNYKTVVIISPSHREYFPGISIFSGEAYKTPLGNVPLDKEMVAKFTEDEKFIFEGLNGHRAEHAVEVQIPFLQVIMRDFSIVPVVIGDQSKIFIDGLARKLAGVADDKTLIVASSDLSHFHTKVEATQIDSLTEKHILDFNFEGLQTDLDKRNCEACGGGGIVAMIKAAAILNVKKTVVLSRSDSGDVTGDSSEVVGYLSAVVYS